jgi:hypothetical protein
VRVLPKKIERPNTALSQKTPAQERIIALLNIVALAHALKVRPSKLFETIS